VKPFKGFAKTTISTLASAAHAGRYLNCVYRSCFLRAKKIGGPQREPADPEFQTKGRVKVWNRNFSQLPSLDRFDLKFVLITFCCSPLAAGRLIALKLTGSLIQTD
jgi:hypothetical protein